MHSAAKARQSALAVRRRDRCHPPHRPSAARPPPKRCARSATRVRIQDHASSASVMYEANCEEEVAGFPEPAPCGAASVSTQRRWDGRSRRLVQVATAAVLGDAAMRLVAQAAAGVTLQETGAWVPLASNLTSYLILSSTFAADGERETTLCYAAGVLCTLALLAQAFFLHAVPAAIFWPALVLSAGSVGTNAAKLAGWLEQPGAGACVWRLWRRIAGWIGWMMLPQVAYLSLAVPAADTATASWGPAAVSLGMAVALLPALSVARLPASWWRAWDSASWCATLLFMLEPVAALAAAARDPGVLLGLAPADFVLPALATGLQVPRALGRDHMWLTGTSWATLFACIQAGIAAAAQGKAAAAVVALAVPALGAGWLLRSAAAAQGLASPMQALGVAAAGYRREARAWKQLAARLRRRLWALLPAAGTRHGKRRAVNG